MMQKVTLLHSEQPKLHRVLAVLRAIGLEQPKLHRVLAVLSAVGLVSRNLGCASW